MPKISTIATVDGLTIVMSGCASDVDKCVEAQVANWKPSEYYPTVEKYRAWAHLVCLQAQGGNK